MNIFVVHASHRLTDHAAHGDGLVAWGFIKALAARGHNLWVVAPRIDILSAEDPRIQLFELLPRTRGKALQLVEYVIRSRILFQRLSRVVRFDIIHQLNPVVRGYSLGVVGARAPLVLGPFVGDWPKSTSASSRIARFRSATVGALRIAADVVIQRQAQALLIATPYALNRLPGLSARSRKIHVIPNGLDNKEFAPLAVTQSTTAAPRSILMVGNATHKGVYTMLAAFERIAESLPDVVLVIAGGGPQADDVRSRVDASRYRARFQLLGPVDRQNMPRVVADATVVCVPSFCEPFGMIVLEAMACAKPVAATNTGGIPYLIGPDSEMLFSPGDDQSLAGILERLLMDHELRESIGEKNRLLVAAHFSWQSVAKKLESTYASLA